MSGATSAVPVGRCDPGQAAQRPEPHGVVRVRQAAQPGRPVGEADRHQRVARELAHGRVREQLQERRRGAVFAQPAERDRGGATVAGVLVGQHPDQVRDQLLAPQGRLHLGVEALARGGGALLDLDHRADRGSSGAPGRGRAGGARCAAARRGPASRPSASSAGPRSSSSSSSPTIAGAASGSAISPSAFSAGYWSHGSPRSASTSRGTAAREPIWPEAGGRGVAHVGVGIGQRR